MDTATTLLVFVGIVILAVLGWAGRKRFPLRIGAGNFFRRKTQVAIVVAGLLIGTAIITSSYVIQSTFDYTIRSAVFRSFDEVDEIIFAPTPRGSHGTFAISVFDDLDANRSTMASPIGTEGPSATSATADTGTGVPSRPGSGARATSAAPRTRPSNQVRSRCPGRSRKPEPAAASALPTAAARSSSVAPVASSRSGVVVTWTCRTPPP